MKTLSIKQPWAHLIAAGIKDIENRTWKTKFRGKIFIHASGQAVSFKHLSLTQLAFIGDHDIKLLENIVNKKLLTSAIIGEIDIIDCVINHGSIWAEKTQEDALLNSLKLFQPEPYKPIYNWVLANPILYDKPILNVKGKLSFWEFDPY